MRNRKTNIGEKTHNSNRAKIQKKIELKKKNNKKK